MLLLEEDEPCLWAGGGCAAAAVWGSGSVHPVAFPVFVN